MPPPLPTLASDPIFKAGWTALHHAGLLSPPTLVSFLLTHGCSPLTVTRRGLTPLDILTAHSLIPGRDDVALLLEEAMREHGWTGSRMELRRRHEDERVRRHDKYMAVKQDIARVLGLDDQWWGDESNDDDHSDAEEFDDDDDDTPCPPDMSYVRRLSPVLRVGNSPRVESTAKLYHDARLFSDNALQHPRLGNIQRPPNSALFRARTRTISSCAVRLSRLR